MSKTYLFGLLFNYQNLKFTIVQINILRCILEECCWRLMNTCNDCQHAVSIGMLNVYVFIFWNPVIVVFPWKLTNAVTMKICGERWFPPLLPSCKLYSYFFSFCLQYNSAGAFLSYIQKLRLYCANRFISIFGFNSLKKPSSWKYAS